MQFPLCTSCFLPLFPVPILWTGNHPSAAPLRSPAPPLLPPPPAPVVLTVCERPPRSPLPLSITSPKSGSGLVSQPMAGRTCLSPLVLPLFSHTIGQTQSVSPGRPGVYAGRQTVRLAPVAWPQRNTHFECVHASGCSQERQVGDTHTSVHALFPGVCL